MLSNVSDGDSLLIRNVMQRLKNHLEVGWWYFYDFVEDSKNKQCSEKLLYLPQDAELKSMIRLIKEETKGIDIPIPEPDVDSLARA